MNPRRLAKAAEAIRETVSTTVLFHLRDPRVKNVTVLRAEATGDMRSAKVYISIMGTPKQQKLCLHGLESARGFIQAKLADRLQTKNTPVLKFVLDDGVKRSIETARLMHEAGLLEGAPKSDAEANASDTDADDEVFDDEDLLEGEFDSLADDDDDDEDAEDDEDFDEQDEDLDDEGDGADLEDVLDDDLENELEEGDGESPTRGSTSTDA